MSAWPRALGLAGSTDKNRFDPVQRDTASRVGCCAFTSRETWWPNAESRYACRSQADGSI